MTKLLTHLKFIFLFSIATSGIYAQCGNIGFESGTTTGWICGSGTYGQTKIQDCKYTFPVLVNYDGNCLNQGGINGTASPLNAKENRHTIVSTAAGNDTNSLGAISCVAPASLFPNGVNTYSFRLGNALGAPQFDSLALSEGIKFKLTVDSSNTGLTYLYALLIKESTPEVHPANMGPRFIVKISDSTNKVIDCYYKLFVPGSTGIQTLKNGVNEGTGQWKYSDWTKVQLDLTPYLGQQITIEFITADCFPSPYSISSNNGKFDTICGSYGAGTHAAYVYLDMYCAPYKVSQPVVCTQKDLVQICAPDGYAAYNWPANQPGIQPPLNKQCVSIVNPKEGDTYTVNLTSYLGTCSTPYTLKLKVNDFMINDIAVCYGTGIQLQAVPVSPGNYAYSWQPQTYLNRYDVADPVFTAGKTTTYTVTMTNKDQISCERVKTVNVTVRFPTTVNAGRDTTIHQGDTVKLHGSIGGGANKAAWIGGQGTFIPNRLAPNAKYLPATAEEIAGTVQLTLESSDTLSPCSSVYSSMNILIVPPTGITKNSYNLSVEMYPNPMNTELTILISGLANTASAELKVYDWLGKEVRTQKLKNGSQKLYRENLSTGIYFIEIADGKNIILKKKIVINN